MSAHELENTASQDPQGGMLTIIRKSRRPSQTAAQEEFELEEMPAPYTIAVCTGHPVVPDKLTREVMKLLQELDAKSGNEWRTEHSPDYKFERYPSNRYLA